ncbi:MAG: zinc ribbon domain-containing protein [Limnochordia bacterium]|jgi:predicted  nucleic acid-binding Zn-ribbon protein
MDAQMKALLEVQQLDMDMAKMDVMMRDLPVKRLILGLKVREKEIQQLLAKKEECLRENQRRSRRLNLDLDESRSQLELLSQKLYSGELKSAKELAQMESRCESLRERADALEEEILTLMLQAEEWDAETKEHQGQLEEVQGELQGHLLDFNRTVKRWRREMRELQRIREEVQASVPPSLLATYERMRAKCQGRVVVEVRNGICGGCNVALSPIHMGALRKGGQGVFCEHCGRLLCLAD